MEAELPDLLTASASTPDIPLVLRAQDRHFLDRYTSIAPYITPWLMGVASDNTNYAASPQRAQLQTHALFLTILATYENHLNKLHLHTNVKNIVQIPIVLIK